MKDSKSLINSLLSKRPYHLLASGIQRRKRKKAWFLQPTMSTRWKCGTQAQRAQERLALDQPMEVRLTRWRNLMFQDKKKNIWSIQLIRKLLVLSKCHLMEIQIRLWVLLPIQIWLLTSVPQVMVVIYSLVVERIYQWRCGVSMLIQLSRQYNLVVKASSHLLTLSKEEETDRFSKICKISSTTLWSDQKTKTPPRPENWMELCHSKSYQI